MDDGGSLAGVEDALPLSAAQQGMLFHSLSEPGTGVYLGLFSATLPADLDLAAFRAAWSEVIGRHQALRSLFVWQGLDAPVQVVRETADESWEELDWSGVASGEVSGALDDYLDQARRDGLELGQAPAMRLATMSCADGRHRFAWVCHHAVVDDWSAAIVLAEVSAMYDTPVGRETSAAAAPLPSPMPWRAFADWLAGRDMAASERFWQEALAGAQATRLQTPRADADARADDPLIVAETELSEDATDALERLASDLRVTLGAVVTAVWSVVLHRLSGMDDVVFGLATTLRPDDLPGIETAVGNFVTTQPVRTDVTAVVTLSDLIRARHEAALAARGNETLSLARIHELLGRSATDPLFDTILSIKQDAFATVGGRDGPALFEGFEGRTRSNFPLAVIVMPGRRLGVRVLASPAVHPPVVAERVLATLQAALEAAPRSRDVAPTDLAVLTEDEARAAEAGDTSPIALPAFRPVLDLIRAQDPASPAVRFGETRLSYDDLTARAGSVAAHLAAAGVAKGDRVAILLDRCLDLPAAIFGVLAAGAAYVPVDPRYPPERIAQMLVASGPRTVLTTADLVDALPVGSESVILLEHATSSEAAAPVPVGPSDLAYVLFTSGSTGAPKGVEVTHGNLAASTAARSLWYGEDPARFLLLSSTAFDSSVAGIFWTATTGGELILPVPEAEKDARLVAEAISASAATHTLCVPSLYEMVLSSAPEGALDTLDVVIVAGEAVPSAVVDRHRRLSPSTRLVNEYGPTEATVWCVANDLSKLPAGAAVPIGRPIPGVRALVRDARGRVVPDGVPGELLIGGAGVANGYIGRPDATAERFVADPVLPDRRLYRTGDLVRRGADGVLIYLGRADDQVKIRGHRVELGEVETVFAVRPDVEEVAVAPVGERGGETLVAFVVPRSGRAPDLERLREDAWRRLPDWAVPTRFVMLPHLPRTPNGKVDRRALPALDRQNGAAPRVPPATSMEAMLAEIWRRILWLDREVGVTEDFSELGGHSLLSMRLVSEIEGEVGLRVPVARLGRITTIRHQARLLEEHANANDLPLAAAPSAVGAHEARDGPFAGLSDDELDQIRAFLVSWPGEPVGSRGLVRCANKTGSLPPLFYWFTSAYQFEQLARYLGPDQPIYGLRSGNEVFDHPSESRQFRDQRRAAMTYVDDVLEVQPEGPFYLGGYCQGGKIAIDAGNGLLGLGKPVATVLVLDKVPMAPFAGHVALMFARDGFLNPYLRFDRPEIAWRNRFRSHSLDFVPGSYLKSFGEPYIQDVASVVRRRLAEARAAPASPAPDLSPELQVLDIPVAIRPGEALSVVVRVSNAGRTVWAPTETSGLRVVGTWCDAAGDPLRAARGHGDLSDEVEAGASRDVVVRLASPDRPGPCRIDFALSEEGVRVHDRGLGATCSAAITIDPSAPPTERGGEPDMPSPQDALAAAQAARDRGDAAAANAILAGQRPDLVAHLREAGLAAAQMGDRRGGVRHLASALAVDPRDARTLLELGRLRYVQRRLPEAFLLLRRARAMAVDEDVRDAAAFLLGRMNYPARAWSKLRRTLRHRIGAS